MNLNSFWSKYESIIVFYSDVNNELKHSLALILTVLPFVVFNYIFYYYILGFNSEYFHLFLIGLAVGKGKLLLFYIMKKNKCDFGGGYNNIFLQILTILTISIGTIIGIYVILKDINGDFKKAPTSKIETIKYNTNFLKTTNKYDYLKNDNK